MAIDIRQTAQLARERKGEDPVVAVAFAVEVDGFPIGDFTACDGLGFEVTVEQREEGGNQLYVHQLPGRLKYTNVKLTRAVGKNSADLAKWVASYVSMASNAQVKRTKVSITAMTHQQQRLVQYNLIDAIPVKWTGPQLGVESSKVATETIEFAHHGIDTATSGRTN